MTGDDPRQATVAQTILAEDFAMTATVLVETEWVLRSRYKMDRDQRVAALRMIIDLPHAVDIPDNAAWAIDRLEYGADFADMMHLAAARGASGFVTFDRRIAHAAGAESPVPVETLS